MVDQLLRFFSVKLVLTVIEVKGNKFVRLSEFYDQMELDRKEYHAFIKRNITKHKIPQEAVDFIAIEPKKNNVGRPRVDFLISLEFLKVLCFWISTAKSMRIKIWADSFSDFTVKNRKNIC